MKDGPPVDKIALYKKLVATNPSIEQKGASMPYTSFNGNMFSFIDKNGLCGIRLPEKKRADFIKKYKTKLFEARGTVLKEYVTVPYNLLNDTKALKKYFDLSYEYVKTLNSKNKKIIQQRVK
jgi:TfoX/Sxy family transcriptional regulator of competence genes